MERAASCLASLQHPRQRHRVEVPDARPQGDIGIDGHLCLHRHEVLDDLSDGPVDPLQQQLPRQQGPVECPLRQDRRSRHVSECRARKSRIRPQESADASANWSALRSKKL